MSRRVEPDPVLRICSCLVPGPDRLPGIEEQLERRFGGIALRSDPFPFDTSDYYAEEIAPDLVRYWYAFRELMGPEQLVESRIATGRIEDRHAVDGRRTFNLDPGYMDMGKLVLASRKEAPDKIYLGGGVWAHTCLRYRFGAFTAPDHSFPDFQDGRFDAVMMAARGLYKSLLRQCAGGR